MTSEQFVRFKEPRVREEIRHGNFTGGKVRFDIMLGRKMIGCDTRRRSAWAQAARYLREESNK